MKAGLKDNREDAKDSPTTAKNDAFMEFEPYVPLEEKGYDVTNYIESCCMLLACPCAGWTRKTLFMSDQEITLKTRNFCLSSKQRRPYAQLGSVDKIQTCCGMCNAFVSDLTPVNEKGEGGIVPQCGCGNEQFVTELVKEAQLRKEKRGGIAQIRKLDFMLNTACELAKKVPLIAQNAGIKFEKQPLPLVQMRTFGKQEIDVSNYIEMVFGCTTRQLVLDKEEAVLTINKCCGCQTLVSKREYGQLGFVEKQKQCCCCFQVASDLSPIPGQSNLIPGCPCTNGGKVGMLVSELRDRMATRGQAGQMRKQSELLVLIRQLNESMEWLTKHHKLQFPPDEGELKKRFGDKPVPDFKSFQGFDPAVTFEEKDHDITNCPEACITCCSTCGIAGWTKQTMSLKADDLYVITKNNLDDSNSKQPYGELDSVDLEQACCCCWTVNVASPGCGCAKELVNEIADDLQKRKEARGNIAQLKQLQAMQLATCALDIKGDQLLKKEGVQYPPSQAVMDQVFPGKKPRPPAAPHIEPHKEFEAKTYDVTNYIEACCNLMACRGWKKRTLNLDPNEMNLLEQDWCSMKKSRTPYGNLGSVETETVFCCCAEVPEVANPQCGCATDMVNAIAEDLQERKVKRGNIAQMKQQENIMNELVDLAAKIEVLRHSKKIAYPPSPEVMKSAFGPAIMPKQNVLGKPVDTE